MSNQTVFFIVGPALVAAALIVAFLGVRSDRFPGSRALQIGATAVFAVLVVTTMAFAWRNAADEQTERDAELTAETEQNLTQGNNGEAQEEGVTTEEPTTTTASVDGAQVFDDQGCGGCHTLSAAGSSGTVGPVLDSVLKGKPATFIKTSIVNPNAFIEKGFPPNTMPENYGETLSPDEIDALVAYLEQSVNGKG